MSRHQLGVGLALLAATWAVPAWAAPAKALSPASTEQLAAADQVGYGRYTCEFKQMIDIERHASPGYVHLRFNKKSWTMKPVISSTGAVRMEDVKGVTLMLQIANKSMLMNTQSGQRVVDGCVIDTQRAATPSPPSP